MATIQDAAPADVMAVGAPGGRRMMRFIGPLVVMLALLSALATFVVLAGLTPISASHEVVIGLLGVNAVAVLLLLGIILREIWPVVQGRRRGRAGARLHVSIVSLFSVIAAAPAILVALVGSITLDHGVNLVLSARNGEPVPRERSAASEKPQRPRSDNRGSLKKRIAEAESEIARVSEIITKIDTALALPDIFTRDPKQAAQLSKARANAADALARAEEQWLEASTQFDEAAG